jgi:hypothetical protein
MPVISIYIFSPLEKREAKISEEKAMEALSA